MAAPPERRVSCLSRCLNVAKRFCRHLPLDLSSGSKQEAVTQELARAHIKKGLNRIWLSPFLMVGQNRID